MSILKVTRTRLNNGRYEDQVDFYQGDRNVLSGGDEISQPEGALE